MKTTNRPALKLGNPSGTFAVGKENNITRYSRGAVHLDLFAQPAKGVINIWDVRNTLQTIPISMVQPVAQVLFIEDEYLAATGGNTVDFIHYKTVQ